MCLIKIKICTGKDTGSDVYMSADELLTRVNVIVEMFYTNE